MKNGPVRVTQPATRSKEEQEAYLRSAREKRGVSKEDKRRRRDMRFHGSYNGNWKLYVLRLKDDYWYVGITHSVNNRFLQHIGGNGAWWVKRHPVIELYEVKDIGEITQQSAEKLEDAKTLEVAGIYGADKVRGGRWCRYDTLPIL